MPWLELLKEDLYKFCGPSWGFWTRGLGVSTAPLCGQNIDRCIKYTIPVFSETPAATALPSTTTSMSSTRTTQSFVARHIYVVILSVAVVLLL